MTDLRAIEFIYRPPDMATIESNPTLAEKYKRAVVICKDQFIVRLHAKGKSKKVKRRYKKVPSKLHKAAVAKV